MRYKIAELINLTKTQVLTDSFCEAVGIASAIIDLDGKILIGSRWQKICTDFHRVNPQTCLRCIESDTILANKLLKGQKYAIYECRNGLTDSAAPIVIEGEHIANFFVGQFLLEPPDIKYFKEMALEYGFDETSYLNALSKVPIIPKERIEPILDFLSGFAEFIGEIGLMQIRQLEAEGELRKERDRAQQYFDIVGVLLIIVDTDQKIVRINKKGCEIFGYEKEDKLIGISYFNTFIPKRLRDEALRVFKLLMEGEVKPAEYFENPVLTKSDEERILAWHNTVLRNEKGEIYAILYSGEDITESKQAEERIEHLNSVLKAIRNVNQLITKEKDRNNLLQKTCEILIEARGYDAAWLGLLKDGKTFAMVKGAGLGEDVNRFSEYVMKGEHPLCIKNSLAEKISLVVIDKSKECGDCFFRDACIGKEAAIIRVEYAGRFFGLLAVLFAADISADKEEKGLLKEVAGDIAFALYSMEMEEVRKQAEEERKRLNTKLFQKNEELEQIVYTASHDLRSPLVNVQGFSKELNESIKEMSSIIKNNESLATVKEKIGSLLEQDIPESLQYILTSISKMDSLLNGLLRLSRLGSAALKPEIIDMDKLINKVVKAFEFKIKESDVKLEISELPSCKADKTQIDQVFSNLIDNALKYLDPKRLGIIKISGTKTNNTSTYCVADNGIGIAPEHQENIFTLFHQLNPDRVPGQGLGLTIVKRILERHRGKVWVESESGKGSKFFISLPDA